MRPDICLIVIRKSDKAGGKWLQLSEDVPDNCTRDATLYGSHMTQAMLRHTSGNGPICIAARCAYNLRSVYSAPHGSKRTIVIWCSCRNVRILCRNFTSVDDFNSDVADSFDWIGYTLIGDKTCMVMPVQTLESRDYVTGTAESELDKWSIKSAVCVANKCDVSKSIGTWNANDVYTLRCQCKNVQVTFAHEERAPMRCLALLLTMARAQSTVQEAQSTAVAVTPALHMPDTVTTTTKRKLDMDSDQPSKRGSANVPRQAPPQIDIVDVHDIPPWDPAADTGMDVAPPPPPDRVYIDLASGPEPEAAPAAAAPRPVVVVPFDAVQHRSDARAYQAVLSAVSRYVAYCEGRPMATTPFLMNSTLHQVATLASMENVYAAHEATYTFNTALANNIAKAITAASLKPPEPDYVARAIRHLYDEQNPTAAQPLSGTRAAQPANTDDGLESLLATQAANAVRFSGMPQAARGAQAARDAKAVRAMHDANAVVSREGEAMDTRPAMTALVSMAAKEARRIRMAKEARKIRMDRDTAAIRAEHAVDAAAAAASVDIPASLAAALAAAAEDVRVAAERAEARKAANKAARDAARAVKDAEKAAQAAEKAAHATQHATEVRAMQDGVQSMDMGV